MQRMRWNFLFLLTIGTLANMLGCSEGTELEAPVNSIASSVSTSRCLRVSLEIHGENEEWVLFAKRIVLNGALEDITPTKAEIKKGFGEICVSAANYDDALLLQAQSLKTATLLSRYIAPAFQNMIGDSSQAPIRIDTLASQLSSILLEVHELPFSGFLGKLTENDFQKLESRLRQNSDVSMELKADALSRATVQRAWNVNIDVLTPVGRQLACLNSQISSGSFSIGAPFSFSGSRSEALSETSETRLNSSGLLESVAGSPLDNMSIRINNVSLQGPVFSSIEHFGEGASGAFLQAPTFDLTGTLDARLSFTQIPSAQGRSTLLPCLIGILTVQNNDTVSQSINGESAICFDAVKRGSLIVSPSDGNQGDWPSSTSEFIVFGDDHGDTSFVLGVPGIHSKAQDDGLRITINSDNVCLSFLQRHTLSPSGEMADTASALWYLCQVSDNNKANTAMEMQKASTQFEVGLRPAQLTASLARDELATEIGRSSFIYNPALINFIKTDARDSLLNLSQGEKTNIVFSGRGIRQHYNVFLNGKGDALAQITTGPQGQWAGAIRIPTAKVGDFFRFKAPSSDQRPGPYFDIDIASSCDP